MKILYLDHPEPDYLSTLLYLGLCQTLGPDAVVDYPYKKTFHGLVHEYPSIYQTGPGSPDWRMTDAGPVETRKPLDWMVAQPGREWSRDEVVAALRAAHFSLVILASPRTYNTAALADLIGAIGRDKMPPLVLVDGEDYTTIRWDYVERFRPRVYFKTSFVREPFRSYDAEEARMTGLVRIVPFPMASTTGPIAARPKDIDVAFLGGNNWRPGRVEGRDPTPLGRQALVDHLAGTFQSFVGGNVADRTQYLDTLARARVAVCVGGSGAEPLRTYEILSCPDTLLMRERINVIAHQPLVDGKTHIGWSTTKEPPFDFTEVVDRIHWALDHEQERLAIAREGNAFCAEHYTPRARARQLLTEAM
jgi:hypothetical protein